MCAYFHESSNNDSLVLKQRVMQIVLIDHVQCARSVLIVASLHWYRIAIASQVSNCERAA
jgi:hypothetical protein